MSFVVLSLEVFYEKFNGNIKVGGGGKNILQFSSEQVWESLPCLNLNYYQFMPNPITLPNSNLYF